MFNYEIKRKSSYKKLIKDIDKAVSVSIKEIMIYAKEIALRNKKGKKDDSLILFEITIENGSVSGRLYTNFDYALFLEYGTGTKAELEHIGHTKTFKESGFTYWFLPKELADAKGLDISSSRLVNIKGELFYMMFATSPQPFMRPTAFELESNVSKIFIESMQKQLRK